ncbi:hypothetical protein BX666DRAFT_1949550 [Dichotomocladium elegans]|nr:hypothetical protein BX666DRAFT_1949550 [Dichotomocladium elegans]
MKPSSMMKSNLRFTTEHTSTQNLLVRLVFILIYFYFFHFLRFQSPIFMSTALAGLAADFWKICDGQGNCHCDWRLTIYGCYEEEHMRPLYIALAAVSGLVGLGATGLLYHRVINLDQHVFDCRDRIPRPKPVESMAAFGATFNLLRMIHAIVIVTDIAPNVAFRSFLFEFPWQFGIGALSCYLFGIAHTLADSSRILYNTWVRAPAIVDCLGVMTIALPFVTNNLCAVAAGVFALQGNNTLAARFTAALYYFWTFYTGFLALLIFVAGIRLLRVLRIHSLERTESHVNLEKIKLGALKVKIIIFAGVGCLSVFVVLMVLYGRLRDAIMRNTGYNIAMAALWMFDGAITTAVIEFGVVLNPRIATLATNFGSSNGKVRSTTTSRTGPIETQSPRPFNFHSKPKFLMSDEFTLADFDPTRSQIEEEQQVLYHASTASTRALPYSPNEVPTMNNRAASIRPSIIDMADASTTSSAVTFLDHSRSLK